MNIKNSYRFMEKKEKIYDGIWKINKKICDIYKEWIENTWWINKQKNKKITATNL